MQPFPQLIMWMMSAWLRLKNSRWFYGLVFSTLLFGSACSGARRPPEVRNHPAPNFKVTSIVALKESGCAVDDLGRTTCPPDSALGRLGCDDLALAGDYLGGLNPSHPINICWVLGSGGNFLAEEAYVYRTGCLLPRYARYVIERDGGFVLIRSEDELRKVYTPITSRDEALSYALAATGLSAYFGFEAPNGFRYFVDQLEDSHVVETDQGYLVYLFDYKLCGCGPHTTSYVEVFVSADGSIEERERSPLFEDPEQDQLCID